jgi:hypothetical protein
MEDLNGVPICETQFNSYCFVNFTESMNYTVWTEVRFFVSLRGKSGGPLTCF